LQQSEEQALLITINKKTEITSILPQICMQYSCRLDAVESSVISPCNYLHGYTLSLATFYAFNILLTHLIIRF